MSIQKLKHEGFITVLFLIIKKKNLKSTDEIDKHGISITYRVLNANAKSVCCLLRPHRWQPQNGILGNNTGDGCHFLLQFMKKWKWKEIKLSVYSCDPPGLRPTENSVHLLQAGFVSATKELNTVHAQHEWRKIYAKKANTNNMCIWYDYMKQTWLPSEYEEVRKLTTTGYEWPNKEEDVLN